MKAKIKIMYQDDKLKGEYLFKLCNYDKKKMSYVFFFLFFFLIKIYIYCVLSPFYFWDFILKAKNKLILIFIKNYL